MKHKNTTKSGFCKSLDWNLPFSWFDLVGIHVLDQDRRARIELATYGTSDHYPGFRVTILNKREGKVDEKFFQFDDYLDRSLAARTDGRDNYPTRGLGRCYEVIGHCGWDWYIATPKDTQRFCGAVEAYIEAFR
jgi:hypothetical protein